MNHITVLVGEKQSKFRFLGADWRILLWNIKEVVGRVLI